MLVEVRGRADDRMSLWAPQRNRDHVAGHEVCHPHAEIESLGDDVDQSSFDDKIDMYLRMTADELQHERREELMRSRGERVDAQGSRRRCLLRAHGAHGGMNVLQRRADLLDERSPSIGQRHAARRPIEEANSKLCLQLCDCVAERGR